MPRITVRMKKGVDDSGPFTGATFGPTGVGVSPAWKNYFSMAEHIHSKVTTPWQNFLFRKVGA